jgi:hypothetical protein
MNQNIFSQMGLGTGLGTGPSSTAKTNAQLSDMLTQASQSLMCGPDCQKQKNDATLGQKLEEAKINLQSAPVQLKQAEKNYYTSVKGVAGYSEYQTATLTTEADNKIKDMTTTFNKNWNEDNDLNEQLKTTALNFQHTQELYLNYRRKNAILRRETDTKINDVTTSDRKTYYETQNNDVLVFWYRLFFWIYVVIYVIFTLGLFLSPNDYTLWAKIALLILFAIFPFVLKPIFLFIMKTANHINSLLPKNVYTSL